MLLALWAGCSVAKYAAESLREYRHFNEFVIEKWAFIKDNGRKTKIGGSENREMLPLFNYWWWPVFAETKRKR